jgi:hypothetical protein
MYRYRHRERYTHTWIDMFTWSCKDDTDMHAHAERDTVMWRYMIREMNIQR